MFTSDKESLCNMHDTIKYHARDIKKFLKKAIKENNFENIESTLNILDSILETTRRAKKTGQKLENRLSVYRFNIEKMGFQRVNKRVRLS